MRFLSHTLSFYFSIERPGSRAGSQGLWQWLVCLRCICSHNHTQSHTAGTLPGRMLHFELMPVTSNNEEIELWNRGKSFDHREKFCLPLYSLTFCIFCWYALFIPFSLLLVKSNRVLSALGAVRANYFLIKCLFCIFLSLTLLRFLFIKGPLAKSIILHVTPLLFPER